METRDLLMDALRKGRQRKTGRKVRGGKIVRQKAGTIERKTGEERIAAIQNLKKARRGTAKQKALRSKRRGRQQGVYDDFNPQESALLWDHEEFAPELDELEEDDGVEEALRVGRRRKSGRKMRGGKVVRQKSGTVKRVTGERRRAMLQNLKKARRGTAKLKAAKSKRRGRQMGLYGENMAGGLEMRNLGEREFTRGRAMLKTGSRMVGGAVQRGGAALKQTAQIAAGSFKRVAGDVAGAAKKGYKMVFGRRRKVKESTVVQGNDGRLYQLLELTEQAGRRDLLVLYLGDGYLAAAADFSAVPRNGEERYFGLSHMYPEYEQSGEWQIARIKNVPEDIADAMLRMGTKEQEYDDGYVAARAVARFPSTVVSEGDNYTDNKDVTKRVRKGSLKKRKLREAGDPYGPDPIDAQNVLNKFIKQLRAFGVDTARHYGSQTGADKATGYVIAAADAALLPIMHKALKKLGFQRAQARRNNTDLTYRGRFNDENLVVSLVQVRQGQQDEQRWEIVVYAGRV